jgi:hypothetical protein
MARKTPKRRGGKGGKPPRRDVPRDVPLKAADQGPSYASDALVIANNELLIEFGDHDFDPRDLDSRTALDLAAAYLDLIHKIGEDDEVELEFKGLEVRDKCVAIVVKTNRIEPTRRAATKAARYLADETPPRRIAPLVQRVRSDVKRLPPQQRVAIMIGKRFQKVLDIKPSLQGPPLASVVTLRATPVRIGGSHPAVRFRSDSEERAFTLELAGDPGQAVDLARSLARFLYAELEIVAEVRRDEDGQIESGYLLEYHELSEGDASEAWLAWYRENASDWEKVKDIERELGRGDRD